MGGGMGALPGTNTEKERLLQELKWAMAVLVEKDKNATEPENAAPAGGKDFEAGVAIDTERLFEEVSEALGSAEARALVKTVVEGLRINRSGGKTVLALDPAGVRALKRLSALLPHGIPIKAETILARVHWQTEEGLHIVLGWVVLPHMVEGLRAWLPETLTIRGVRYYVPHLHERLEGFAFENATLFVKAVREAFGNHAPGGLNPAGVRA